MMDKRAALSLGNSLKSLILELRYGWRSYPSGYVNGHILVGMGLAEYVETPTEGENSYWLKLRSQDKQVQ